jgi:hypothetical protein
VEPHAEAAYRFAGEALAEAGTLVRRFPGKVVAEEIGRSVEDRPIWAFHVRDPSQAPTRKLLVFANIHAMEWVPTEVAMEFLLEVSEAPPAGASITVIPVLNPDGRARVEADLLEGRRAYRRGNANGVDLNRDFAANREAKAIWKYVIPRRYTTSPSALSQPESRALAALAAREIYDSAISLHAFGGFVYYPWAGRWERAEDYGRLHALATEMASAQSAHAYKPRQLARWGFFFRGHGMELDHLYAEHGTLAYLVETTRSGQDLLRPGEWGFPFRWYNPRQPARHAEEGAALLRAWSRSILAKR